MTQSNSTEIKRVIVARLSSGEDIVEALERIAKRYDIKGAQLTLIGAIKRATLGYFNIDQNKYKTFTIEKELEVASCMGNIARLNDNSIVVHAHMVASDNEGKCYGGHVMKGCEVSATIEAVIFDFGTGLKREKDEKTGLNLLSIS